MLKKTMNFKTYIEGLENEIYVFCDMDGVLCNWELHFQNAYGKNHKDMSDAEVHKLCKQLPIEWWAKLPWLPDGKELWKYLSDKFPSLYILSSPTQDTEEKSVKGKWEWLRNEGIVDQIGEQNIIIASDKFKYVKKTGVSFLIDDTAKKINEWRKAGGVGILHTSTKKTIKELHNHLHI